MRALIYARVSSDRRQGRSVAEQEAECRDVCTREGWTVAAVLTDNDRSASRHATKARPAWDTVKERIAAGDVDVLVTWEASRAQRDLDAYAELRRLCADHGVRWSYSGQVYDLSDRTDRFRTGLDALVAEDEADRTRDRVLRAFRANARDGRPHGRCPFGYRRTYDPIDGRPRQEIDHDQADILRECAARFLAGESTHSIAADLTSRGVATPRGGRWDGSAIRRIITNPAVVGVRTHNGAEVGPAAWPAVLDDTTYRSVVARFADPSRRSIRQTPRANLLAGVVRCGVCGGPMIVGRTRGSGTAKTYACRRGRHVTRNQATLDTYVTAIVLARLAEPDAAAALAESDAQATASTADAEIIDLRARLDDAYTAFQAGELSATLLGRVEADIVPLISAAERRARVALLPTVAHDLAAADDIAAAWEALTVEQRREVLRAMVTVSVLPVRKRGRGGFDPETDLDVEWLRETL